MLREHAQRFEQTFMPRIAGRIARLIRGARIEIIPGAHPHAPARMHVSAEPPAPGEVTRRYPFALNVYLTWDDNEIERLMHAQGEARFMRYLDAIDLKFGAWQGARDVDLVTRSQAEPSVLFGGLDFEA